nr:hypothetical protein [uncultured Ruminococcus sp.]
MTFPKAERGIKIVFLAQISFMLASIFSTASAIGNMINYYIYINFPEEELLLAPFSIIAILAVIFLLAGFALTIIGVLKASGEDENFKVALYSILFGVALSIIGMIWSGDNAVGTITGLLTTLTSFLAIIYVIQGIRSMSLKLDKPEMEQTGSKLYTLFSVFYVIETCSNIAILIFNDNSSFIIVSLLQIFFNIMSVMQYLIFMLYLRKAIKMLAVN